MIRLLCHIHYCDEVDKLSEAEWPTTKEWTIVTKDRCEICCEKGWRVKATIDRLISNIPAACKVLKEQGYVNLAGQLRRDCENLEYWQARGGLKEVSEENIPNGEPAG